jgi:hypothetical protein
MVARIAIAVALGASACTLDASAQTVGAAPPARARLATAPNPIVAVPLTVPRQPTHLVRCRVVARRAADSVEREVGTQTREVHMITVDGRRAIQRVMTFATPRGTVVDSTVTFVDGLAPVAEVSHQPTKVMRLSFDGGRVTGTVTPTDSAAHVVDEAGEPVFNSTDLDLVVSSLPLTEGYRTVLPFYVYEHGGLERDTISVSGTELVQGPSGARRAWVAHVAMPGTDLVYWIDAETRDVLQSEFHLKGGVVMRLIRI